MERSANLGRIRLGALALALAGVLFVLYPAARPFSDEASLQGAAAFASSAWVFAHLLAMLAFILLTWGLLALSIHLQGTSAERLAFWALGVSWLGAGLTLPFYGAEAFGLQAIGREALARQNPALLGLANAVRTGPGLPLIVAGLALLAVGTILAAVAAWKSRALPKWSGVPLALGFALYIPQYTWPQPLRVAHGALVTAGCLAITIPLWRHRRG